MFEGLRRRLRAALDSLERRLAGGDRADEMDRLLAGMREELIEARAALEKRRERVRGYERRLARLEGSGVDPSDLARLAREVEGRRREVEEEAREVEALGRRYREATRRRDALLASERRARASREVREAGGEAVESFERAEERIEDGERLARAERELAGEMDPEGSSGDPAADEELRRVEADAILRELKRELEMDPEEG